MTKIIKIESCFDCKFTSYEREQIDCPIKYQNNHQPSKFPDDSIHMDCPLEGYKTKKKFSEYDKCLYCGNILCSDCERKDYCDMKAGRELHQKYYEAG